MISSSDLNVYPVLFDLHSKNQPLGLINNRFELKEVESMLIDIVKKILPITALGISMLAAAPVFAADIVVAPASGLPYGSHEVWAHSQMGQSFVAQAASVKAGFLVEYDALSAALSGTNASATQMVANLYEGEGFDGAKLLATNTVTADTATKGYLDVDYSTSGISLVPGNTYTLSLSSVDSGWKVPSVCDYPANQQPTGAYAAGHPFFQGAIVLDETGICDNAFHVIDMTAPVVVTPTPTPTVISPTPTVASSRLKKIEGKGVITGVVGPTIVVKNVTLVIDSATVIKLNYNTALAVGLKVEYKGYKNADGTVTATFIEVK